MNEKSAQQIAVLWVVRAACIVFVGGATMMGFLAWRGIAIPDQFDRLVNLAGVGALALLGRTSDTKAEAKEAAEKMVDDLTALAPAPAVPIPVVGPGGGPVETRDVTEGGDNSGP